MSDQESCKRLSEARRKAATDALTEAADAIQALHPGEVKNSVIFLRERAATLAADSDKESN